MAEQIIIGVIVVAALVVVYRKIRSVRKGGGCSCGCGGCDSCGPKHR